MANCELIKGCVFFNDKMATTPVTAELYKKTYCQGNNAECARYMVFKAKGREKVPPDLFPNQKDRATALL